MRQTLLLDASFYPIQMIDWKKALTLFFTERAEVVELHQDIEIKSTHSSFKLPKVMRLFYKVGNVNFVKFNRLNVFSRDKFICQYCGNHFKSKDLTLDHVVPRSKGGKTEWNNIVSACSPCNTKKADKLLRDISSMQLLRKPFEPKWMSLFIFKLSMKEKSVWYDWFHFK